MRKGRTFQELALQTVVEAGVARQEDGEVDMAMVVTVVIIHALEAEVLIGMFPRVPITSYHHRSLACLAIYLPKVLIDCRYSLRYAYSDCM